MAQFQRPVADQTLNTWETDGGSTSNIYTAIDEVSASDTDFVLNGNNVNDLYEVLMTNLSATPPGAGTCTVRYRYSKSAAGGNSKNMQVFVYEGVTLRATGTLHSDISDAWTAGSFTFSAGDIAVWSNVRFRFEVSGDTGGNPGNRRSGRISWAEIETPDQAVVSRRVFIIS